MSIVGPRPEREVFYDEFDKYIVGFRQRLQIKPGLTGLAMYHGHSNDMRPFYDMCSCTVLPSYYPEGMSNVLLESSASARPCITTDRSGCKEVVDDGVTGYICKQQDAQSLKECMGKFMLLSHEERKNMGLCARKKVEKEFDRQIVVDNYISQIDKL